MAQGSSRGRDSEKGEVMRPTVMTDIVGTIEQLAFEIPPPNHITPQIIQACQGIRTELSRLRAEREKLVEGLREIQRVGEEGMKPDFGNWLTFHDKIAVLARSLLSQVDK